MFCSNCRRAHARRGRFEIDAFYEVFGERLRRESGALLLPSRERVKDVSISGFKTQDLRDAARKGPFQRLANLVLYGNGERGLRSIYLCGSNGWKIYEVPHNGCVSAAEEAGNSPEDVMFVVEIFTPWDTHPDNLYEVIRVHLDKVTVEVYLLQEQWAKNFEWPVRKENPGLPTINTEKPCADCGPKQVASVGKDFPAMFDLVGSADTISRARVERGDEALLERHAFSYTHRNDKSGAYGMGCYQSLDRGTFVIAERFLLLDKAFQVLGEVPQYDQNLGRVGQALSWLETPEDVQFVLEVRTVHRSQEAPWGTVEKPVISRDDRPCLEKSVVVHKMGHFSVADWCAGQKESWQSDIEGILAKTLAGSQEVLA